MNFQVVKDFERELCRYTGSKYAVTCTSCTSALLIACAYFKNVIEEIDQQCTVCLDALSIPKLTYVGVPQSIIHAGYKVQFHDRPWSGCYQIEPLPVWDYARRFTSDMYIPGTYQCVSFHPTKILGLRGYGGAILHDDEWADEWLRRARFDGRKEGVEPKYDNFTKGWHCYMSPQTAGEGLRKLASLNKYNMDLPNSDYPDLSRCEVFQ
jgi:dTDP-4-amino-4,6-dideoxygalactose transaminase